MLSLLGFNLFSLLWFFSFCFHLLEIGQHEKHLVYRLLNLCWFLCFGNLSYFNLWSWFFLSLDFFLIFFYYLLWLSLFGVGLWLLLFLRLNIVYLLFYLLFFLGLCLLYKLLSILNDLLPQVRLLFHFILVLLFGRTLLHFFFDCFCFHLNFLRLDQVIFDRLFYLFLLLFLDHFFNIFFLLFYLFYLHFSWFLFFLCEN